MSTATIFNTIKQSTTRNVLYILINSSTRYYTSSYYVSFTIQHSTCLITASSHVLFKIQCHASCTTQHPTTPTNQVSTTSTHTHKHKPHPRPTSPSQTNLLSLHDTLKLILTCIQQQLFKVHLLPLLILSQLTQLAIHLHTHLRVQVAKRGLRHRLLKHDGDELLHHLW